MSLQCHGTRHKSHPPRQPNATPRMRGVCAGRMDGRSDHRNVHVRWEPSPCHPPTAGRAYATCAGLIQTLRRPCTRPRVSGLHMVEPVGWVLGRELSRSSRTGEHGMRSAACSGAFSMSLRTTWHGVAWKCQFRACGRCRLLRHPLYVRRPRSMRTRRQHTQSRRPGRSALLPVLVLRLESL